MTVGMREVEAKRTSWRHHPDRDKPDFLGRQIIAGIDFRRLLEQHLASGAPAWNPYD